MTLLAGKFGNLASTVEFQRQTPVFGNHQKGKENTCRKLYLGNLRPVFYVDFFQIIKFPMT